MNYCQKPYSVWLGNDVPLFSTLSIILELCWRPSIIYCKLFNNFRLLEVVPRVYGLFSTTCFLGRPAQLPIDFDPLFKVSRSIPMLTDVVQLGGTCVLPVDSMKSLIIPRSLPVSQEFLALYDPGIVLAFVILSSMFPSPLLMFKGLLEPGFLKPQVPKRILSSGLSRRPPVPPIPDRFLTKPVQLFSCTSSFYRMTLQSCSTYLVTFSGLIS